MSIVSGPNIVPNSGGLIYHIDPGNTKSYNPSENLYPQSETLPNFSISNAGSPSFVSSGGPYNGPYYITTATAAQFTLSNYWFDFTGATSLSVNQGDVITQTWHVLPIVTATNTITNQIGVRFWSGSDRAWLENVTAQYNLPSLSVTSIQGPTTGSNYTSAAITQLSNGWYRLSFTAQADASGAVATSLYNSQMNTGTQYGVAAHQVEKNTAFTQYTPTYGSPIYRSTSIADISGNNSTASSIIKTPLYATSNTGYFNMLSAFTATSSATYINTPFVGNQIFMMSGVSSTASAFMNYTISIWANFIFQPNTGTIYFSTLVGNFYYEGFGIGWCNNQGNTNTLTVFPQCRFNSPTYADPSPNGYVTQLNVWNHYAVALSYTQNTYKFYVNGKVYGSSTPNFNSTYYFNPSISNQKISIASSNCPGATSGYPSFPGLIGPVSMYNIALSDDQILQEFNAYRGRYGV